MAFVLQLLRGGSWLCSGVNALEASVHTKSEIPESLEEKHQCVCLGALPMDLVRSREPVYVYICMYV